MTAEDDLYSHSPPPFMCLIEEPGNRNAGDVNISMITICPSTGDVVWDDFEGEARWSGLYIHWSDSGGTSRLTYADRAGGMLVPLAQDLAQ